MTGPRSLYDLSLPIEETEKERIARLNSEGSFRLDRAGTGWKSPMADVPPLPPDPAMALLERAKQGPASDNQWSQGWNSSVIGMQQDLSSIPGVLEVGDDQHATQKLDEFRRIDAGETLPPGSARVNQPYLRGSPEVRAALRAKAQAEQDAARSAYGAREATNARLEEEKARHTPRVSRASEVWASGSLRDASDYVKGIAGGLFPSVGASIAGGLVAGPWGAAAVSGALGGGETLSQGMTRGREAYEKVIPWAIGSAPLHALAERLGLPARYFSPTAKKGAAGAIAGEAMAEGSQYTIGQAALTGALGDPFFTKENLVGLADATVGGAVGGGIAHTGFSAAGGRGGTQIPPLPTTQDKRAPTFQGYIKEPLPDLPEPQDKRTPPLQAPSEKMFQRAAADPAPPGMYSEIRRVFEDGPDEAMANVHAQNFAAYMNKPAPGRGIKPLELEQSGILDFLESRKALGEPVAKSEIIDHLDSKAVKLEVLDRSEQNEDTRWHYVATRAPGDQQTTPGGGEPGSYEEFIITAPEMTKTKEIPPYSDEDLQGWKVVRPKAGTSDELRAANTKYRDLEEQLVQLNRRILDLDRDDPVHMKLLSERQVLTGALMRVGYDKQDAENATTTRVLDEAGTEMARFPVYSQDAKKTDDVLRREVADRHHQNVVKNDKNAYTHSHWPKVKNPIAHARYDQRADPEGNLYFTLQEGQSDIHQEAQAIRLREISRLVRDEGMDKAEASKKVPRDFGYETAAKKQARDEAAAAYKAATDAWAAATDAWDVDPSKENDDRRRALYVAKQEAATRVNELTPMGKPLPDAPFKDWMPLVLKTALAKAVKQGLSRFAWTTGDAQNQRNQLSTKIRKLNYHISPDGKYEIEAFPLDRDDRTPVTMTVHPAELTEAVGKDIAGRIQAQEGEVVANSRSVDPISMALHNQSVAIREWAGFDQWEWRDLTSAQRRGAAKEWLASDDQYAMDTAASYAENSGATAQRSLTGEGLEMKGDGKRQIYDVMAKNELERLGKRWGVKTKSVMLPSEPIGGRAGEDEDGNPGEGPRYEVKVAGPSYGRAKLDNVPGATYRIFDNDNSKTVELFPTREEAENALRQKYTEHEPYHYIDIPPEMAKSISEEGLPLYQRSGKEAEPGTGKKLAHDLEAVYERSPEYVAKRQKIEDAAMAIIRKVAPGLTLEVADRLIAEIDGKREEVMGAYYTPALDGNLIDHMVAISMNSPDWQATLNHEVVHFLKRAGYINDGEWSVLQKKAEGKGLDKVENARMADLRSREELNASEKKELTGLENKANWIQRFDIEKLYPGKKDIWAEEAVAKAKEAFLRGELKPGTFTAKVFDKIAQFFDALGLRLEEFGFTSPGQVFRRVDTGEVGGRAPGRDEAGTALSKKPKAEPVPIVVGTGHGEARNLSNINIIDAKKNSEIKKRNPGDRTKRDIGFELHERAKRILSGVGLPTGPDALNNPRVADLVSDAIALELIAAKDRTGNAGGWYSSKIKEAMRVAALTYPEIETDPRARVAYKLGLAISSQNMSVPANTSIADAQYKAFKETGVFPLIGQGTASGLMKKNFAKVNSLLATYTPEEVEKFLNTKFTVGELKAAGLPVSGENVDQEVYGSAIFGPKIGNGFYQNLIGNYSPLTMDMWFMRGVGRLTGNLMPGNKQLADKQARALREALADEAAALAQGKNDARNWLADLTPRPDEAEDLGITSFTEKNIQDDDVLMELAHRLDSWFTRDFKVNRAMYDSKELEKPAVVSTAQRLLTQGATNDQPGSGGKRKKIRALFQAAVDKAAPHIPGLTMADAQALWWYPEKDLYSHLGYRSKNAEPTDYAQEMAKLAKRGGKTDEEIDEARKAPGVPAGGPPVPGESGGDTGADRGARPTYGKSERQEFLTARVLREIGGRDPGRLSYERRAGDGKGPRPLVNGRAIAPVHRFNLPQTTANALRTIGVTAPPIYELPAQSAAPEFHAAISAAKAGHPAGAAVYVYSPEEYAEMQLFTTANGKAGFALKGDDIVSMFNSDPEIKAWALTALMLAVQQGGRRLDAFDIGLPRIYSQLRFRAVSRIPWSDPDKPADWDKKAFARFNNGEPDVVLMRHDPAYGKLYEPGDGEKFTGPDAYSRAAKKQEKP